MGGWGPMFGTKSQINTVFLIPSFRVTSLYLRNHSLLLVFIVVNFFVFVKIFLWKKAYDSCSRIIGIFFFHSLCSQNLGMFFNSLSHSWIYHFKVENHKGNWKFVRTIRPPIFSASTTLKSSTIRGWIEPGSLLSGWMLNAISNLFFCLFLSFCLFVFLSFCLSVFLSFCLSVLGHLSSF